MGPMKGAPSIPNRETYICDKQLTARELTFKIYILHTTTSVLLTITALDEVPQTAKIISNCVVLLPGATEEF